MKRIVCFHSDVDFGVTTHLAKVLNGRVGGRPARGSGAERGVMPMSEIK